jgi:hypothetical protein
MLSALMGGRSMTATELARLAGITPQTASVHLARLVQVQLLAVQAQGRHRYHRLASSRVARLLEDLMLHASEARPRSKVQRFGPRDEAMRAARTCYDHLAGRLAVTMADAFLARGLIEFGPEAERVTAEGKTVFTAAGILSADDIVERRSGRPLCRACLDWSERRSHIAGRLGAALCQHGFANDWYRRDATTRAVVVTPKGRAALKRLFGVEAHG